MKKMQIICLILGLCLTCCDLLFAAEDFAESTTGLPWGVSLDAAIKKLGPPSRIARPSNTGRRVTRKPREGFVIYEPARALGHQAHRGTYYFVDDRLTGVHYNYIFHGLSETEPPLKMKELADQLALNTPKSTDKRWVRFMRPQAESRPDWHYYQSSHDQRTAVSMQGKWFIESGILNVSVWFKDQAYNRKKLLDMGDVQQFSSAAWAQVMAAPFQPYAQTAWGTKHKDIRIVENDEDFYWPFSSTSLNYEKFLADWPYEVRYEFQDGKLCKTHYVFRSLGLSLAAAQSFCEKIISLLDDLPKARSATLESFDEVVIHPGLTWYCHGMWLNQQTGVLLLGHWDEYRSNFILHVEIMEQGHPRNAPKINNIRQNLNGLEKSRKAQSEKKEKASGKK